MLERGDKVCVGLSGGKDSAALLYLLSKHKERFGIEISAVLIDEGIDNYRSITKEAAEKLCKQLNIHLNILSYQKEFGSKLDEIPKKLDKKINWCSWCGVFRRSLLNKGANAVGANKLAVGHNLDDEAQSVMMNFFRGDINQFQRLGSSEDVEGLARRIKPLKDVPEKETTIFTILNDLPFSDIECPHSSEMMRRKVGEFMNTMEFEHPGTKLQAVAFHKKLQKQMTANPRELKKCGCGEPTSREICKKCELLNQLSEPLSRK